MTICFSISKTIRILFVSALFFFSTCLIHAQSRIDFAKSLMQERDYFRAISIYKELNFYTKDKDSSVIYLSQIGKAYRLSQKYELSVNTFATILNSCTLSDSIHNLVYLNLGLNYLGMKVSGQAIPYFQEANKKDSSGLAELYLGLVHADGADWDKAQQSFDKITHSHAQSDISAIANEYSSKITNRELLPHRNPVAATILSTILPGAGQLYSNHYVDAIQAFGYVAAFGLATYIAYQNDKHYNSNYVLTGISLSITGLFHLANIVGASNTASYFNHHQMDMYFQDVRQKTLNIDF